MKSTSILLVVLVLVGVPAGVAVVAHETPHPNPPALRRATLERQVMAELEHEGAKQIHCGWTKDPAFTVTCSGSNGSMGVGVTIHGADSR